MRIFTLLSILLIAACTQPIVMIPGGKLHGDVTAAPAAWSSIPDVVQLEVRPSDPYSINIWALVDNGQIYLGTQDAQWVPMIEADNNVVIGIEGKLYELAAKAVSNEAEIASVADAYLRKYDFDLSDFDDAGGAVLYRLDNR